ncbi:MAG: molybdenum cofactor guanylyltransferase [Phycisphaerales bacterium]
MPDPLSQSSLPSRRAITPIVLVGGRSTRFGRDKLLEPWGDDARPLVQRPIEALRCVFGPHVMLVGDCSDSVRSLGDGSIPDLLPGHGPLGGIVSAISRLHADVFVLAGDMPDISPGDVSRILLDADRAPPTIWAIIGQHLGLHPCIGVYRHEALDTLRERLAIGRCKLIEALPPDRVLACPIPPSAARNINSPADASPN